MITWRADKPAAPPPMIQISMVSPLTVPPSGESVRPLSLVACMRRARSGRPKMFVKVKARSGGGMHPGTDENVNFTNFDPIRVDPSRWYAWE